LNGPVAAQIEELGENTVRLTVDVPAHDMHHAVEHAAGDLATSLKIPGFRKGKVPIPVLLARIGKEKIYAEAVESHIGGWFWNAAASARIHPVEQPSFDFELPESDKSDWRFSATVAVQTKPEPADWTTLEVPAGEADVPAELVDRELEALQRAVAELVPVEGRPAREGDTLVVDIVDRDGEAQRDYVVELGEGRLIEELETGLLGLSAGESKELTYELGDESTRTVTVTLKELKEKVLPPLDDKVAQSASEFDTIEELRGDIESRLREQLEDELEGQFRAATVDALVAATEVEAAGPLVESRTRELLTGLARSLQQRGIDAETYLQVTGQTAETLAERMRTEASQSVARELVLEAVASKLEIEVSDDEIRSVLTEQGAEAAEIEEIFAAGRHEQLREDLRLRNALDRVVSEVRRIPLDLAEAREAIWTPEQEKPEPKAKLWTPGSKEPA